MKNKFSVFALTILTSLCVIAIQSYTPLFEARLDVSPDEIPTIEILERRHNQNGLRDLIKVTVKVNNSGLLPGHIQDIQINAIGLNIVPIIEIIAIDRRKVYLFKPRTVEVIFAVSAKMATSEMNAFSIGLLDQYGKWIGQVQITIE